MTTEATEGIQALLHEERTFPPSAEFTAQANGTAEMYDRADADREGFWAEQARKYVKWETDFDRTLDWSGAPFAKWFLGGRLNACVNAVDRHVEAGNGDRVAIHFVGEPEGDTRDITYADLHAQVQKAANALADLGVRQGDAVAIYLPMIPEAVVAMLACARIGAPHTVVFGGFSADALRSRIADAGAKVVITADGGWRRGKASALKPAVDAALESGENPVEKVLVVRRTGQDVAWDDARDQWWDDALAAAADTHEPEAFDAEHPLFILYTSGTTGKPKGVFHATGGFVVQTAYTSSVVLDIHPESDVYWCTADIGWVTGHSYIVYGPMTLGATQVMYEGTPDTPHQGRFWEIVQDKRVTILYTAPTAIRTFMKWGTDIPAKFDLSSLRLLGSVGEPINPEAWMWYHRTIGGERCPIVDTWWQTETGGHMITPLPGCTPTKPGSCTLPFFGVDAAVVNERGEEQPPNTGGLLVVRRPWPGMLRGIYGDRERFVQTYFSRVHSPVNGEPYYFTGDGARRDADGYFWIMGRVDDVINVAGHRLGTMEVESALVSHEAVVEAAVVGMPHEIKGTG
ncbi:MAG: acetate--CoA ligase, partial [Acidobacteria bacterium]